MFYISTILFSLTQEPHTSSTESARGHHGHKRKHHRGRSSRSSGDGEILTQADALRTIWRT